MVDLATRETTASTMNRKRKVFTLEESSDSGKACRAIAVEFHMDEAISASELAKKVNVLDAILWLKSAWDNVQSATIQKCFTN